MGSASKVIVITGAGSGIGRVLTRGLLAAGHRVALAGRREDALCETAGKDPNAVCVPTDVRDPDSVRRLFAAVDEQFGRVDVLINNAGVFGRPASIDEVTDEDWDTILAANVSGSVYCAREAIKRMKEQGDGGRVINNGSISARVPRPRSIGYTTTKHAITGLTRSINLDGRAHQITATELNIGNAATAMTSGMIEAPQPDGTRRAEPTFDPEHLVAMIRDVIALPNTVAVPELMVIAAGMPFAGRG
ncbi:SDR family oxidoreductase [Cumulibacter soli]|uniref:SDR family oxidoreductase n=1 Tax=Cumulibacter soli TaxID=2546344 RepID=UPI001068B0DD|nr:SDR family oxidoreductase [Cumulibacter soli]